MFFLNSRNTYNELDQLVCVICKIVVRNESVWPVHLNSKSHKDNIVLARKFKQGSMPPPQATTSMKRPSTTNEPQEPKKVRGILKNSGQTLASVKNSLPADFFEKPTSSLGSILSAKKNLTNGSSSSTETVKPEENAAEGKDAKDSQSTLPEGFFDDPVKDAKVIRLRKTFFLPILLSCSPYSYLILEEWKLYVRIQFSSKLHDSVIDISCINANAKS